MAAYGSNTGGIPVMASARPKGAKISASCGRVGTCRYLLLVSLIYVYHDTDSMPPPLLLLLLSLDYWHYYHSRLLISPFLLFFSFLSSCHLFPRFTTLYTY